MPKVNSLASNFKRRQWAHGQKRHHHSSSSSWQRRKHTFTHWCFERTQCVCSAKTSPINILRTHVVRSRATFQPIFRCHVSCRVKHVRAFIRRRHLRPAPVLPSATSPSFHQHHETFFWPWQLQVKHYAALKFWFFSHLPPFVACRSQSNSEHVWNTVCAAFFLRHVYAHCILNVVLSLAPIDGRVGTWNSKFSRRRHRRRKRCKKELRFQLRSTDESGAWGSEEDETATFGRIDVPKNIKKRRIASAWIWFFPSRAKIEWTVWTYASARTNQIQSRRLNSQSTNKKSAARFRCDQKTQRDFFVGSTQNAHAKIWWQSDVEQY